MRKYMELNIFIITINFFFLFDLLNFKYKKLYHSVNFLTIITLKFKNHA